MEPKVIIDFYKGLIHIFGICPCCKEIFHLSEANLSISSRKLILSESKRILELQRQNMNRFERVNVLEDQTDYRKYEISELKLELKSKDNQEVTRVKREGRREAINSTKSVTPVFDKKKFDPRDARLIFSPVEFLIFNGLTETKEIDNLILLSRKPQSVEQEKISKSISDTIKNGNFNFRVIRFNNNGKIEY